MSIRIGLISFVRTFVRSVRHTLAVVVAYRHALHERSPMSTNTLPRPMLSVDAVAEILGVSSRSVRRMADSGRMPAPIRIGRFLRWHPTTLNQWLDDGCPPVRRTR